MDNNGQIIEPTEEEIELVVKTGPTIDRANSKQDYQTPPEFLQAVEARFGKIAWDLAAHSDNHVVDDYLGPGSSLNEDALAVEWHNLPRAPDEILWLNPPFKTIPRWAKRCAEESLRIAEVEGCIGCATTIAFLVPASVSTNWFAEHVEPYALVLPIRPRITFVGESNGYPKDLMLAVYGLHGFEPWRWKGEDR